MLQKNSFGNSLAAQNDDVVDCVISDPFYWIMSRRSGARHAGAAVCLLAGLKNESEPTSLSDESRLRNDSTSRTSGSPAPVITTRVCVAFKIRPYRV